jgi:DNA-binding transcriptional MerR regulator
MARGATGMALTDPAASETLSGDPGRGDAGRRGAKSASAFRTISEVATDLNVPQHVLRFWETRFAQIRPLKRAGGRRYYRPEDVELLRRIRDLLYRHGYTIRGAQRLLREQGRGGGEVPPPPAHEAEAEAEGELEAPGLVAPAPVPAAAPAHEAAASAPALMEPPAAAAGHGDHIGEVIAELSALRDLLRARGRK